MILYPRPPNGGLLFIPFPLQRLNKYAKVDNIQNHKDVNIWRGKLLAPVWDLY